MRNIDKTVEVSVCVMTYNCDKYISQALDSILDQNVNFSYEIIISDDCSTDETVKIIKQYVDKYDFIRLNINKKNLGITKNCYLVRSLCKGKYICDIAGDDFWIDNNKMQKQYDFLERNKEVFFISGRIKRHIIETDKYILYPSINETNKEFTLDMFLEGKDMHMNGFMMRNAYLTTVGKEWFSLTPKMSPYIDDLTDCFLILNYGKAYIMDNIFVEYRSRSNDQNFNSINKGLSSFRKHVELINNLDNYFTNKYDFFYRYRNIVSNGIKQAIFTKKWKEFIEVYNKIPLKYRKRNLLLSTVFILIPKKIVYIIMNGD